MSGSLIIAETNTGLLGGHCAKKAAVNREQLENESVLI